MELDNTQAIISKIGRIVDEIIIQELNKANIHDIAPTHGSILMTLFDIEHISMGELATKINKTPQTVTTLVSKLQKLGYVKTLRCKHDKRSTFVKLTPQGEVLKPIFIEISALINTLQYQNIDCNQIDFLKLNLNQMLQNFIQYKNK